MVSNILKVQTLIIYVFKLCKMDMACGKCPFDRLLIAEAHFGYVTPNR